MYAKPGTKDRLDVRAFPDGFAWGLSSAAYPIEGAVDQGGRGRSIWDAFSRRRGAIRGGDTGDVACDHYHRWEADLDLLASLKVGGYRLSVSWSRLQPDGRGELNPEAVAFYRKVLAGLRARGIEPFVTLYHWDLPAALEAGGGWAERETARRFAEYARLTVTALGDLATRWITLNEPWSSALLGYGYGKHAPGRTDLTAAVAAAHHLALAHGLATLAIREAAPSAEVGITNTVTHVTAAGDSAADRAAADRLDAITNRLFLDPIYRGRHDPLTLDCVDPMGLWAHLRTGDLEIISTPTDFAGISHGRPVIAGHDPAAPFGVRERPALAPAHLHRVLTRVASDFTALPLYVTETGTGHPAGAAPSGQIRDLDRVHHLSGSFTAAARALSDGVDLRGYFVWSFMDNFEWAEGYSKRLGVVHVDHRTQQRIPRLSAHWYRDLIVAHGGVQDLDAVPAA
ncbi:GH1 family beta-glucosidase [Nonomuraea sp. NPDC050643]|uniref:GH1 family beta-glucosidase n=1 Tax=Nonomuraea sp. NPDC050643 TaxID=3155660 RepID=UPI0033F0A8B3